LAIPFNVYRLDDGSVLAKGVTPGRHFNPKSDDENPEIR
jgi:hypothetical protein